MDIPASCLQHQSNPVSGHCVRCGRPVCDLCTFWVGSALFCPECITSGPSADERSSVFTKGLLSIGLSVAGMGIFAALLLAGAMGLNIVNTPIIRLADYPLLAAALGGIAVGLIAREGAARTGSVLPLIGIICNGVVLGIELVFSVMALAGG